MAALSSPATPSTAPASAMTAMVPFEAAAVATAATPTPPAPPPPSPPPPNAAAVSASGNHPPPLVGGGGYGHVGGRSMPGGTGVGGSLISPPTALQQQQPPHLREPRPLPPHSPSAQAESVPSDRRRLPQPFGSPPPHAGPAPFQSRTAIDERQASYWHPHHQPPQHHNYYNYPNNYQYQHGPPQQLLPHEEIYRRPYSRHPGPPESFPPLYQPSPPAGPAGTMEMLPGPVPYNAPYPPADRSPPRPQASLYGGPSQWRVRPPVDHQSPQISPQGARPNEIHRGVAHMAPPSMHGPRYGNEPAAPPSHRELVVMNHFVPPPRHVGHVHVHPDKSMAAAPLSRPTIPPPQNFLSSSHHHYSAGTKLWATENDAAGAGDRHQAVVRTGGGGWSPSSGVEERFSGKGKATDMVAKELEVGGGGGGAPLKVKPDRHKESENDDDAPSSSASEGSFEPDDTPGLRPSLSPTVVQMTPPPPSAVAHAKHQPSQSPGAAAGGHAAAAKRLRGSAVTAASDGDQSSPPKRGRAEAQTAAGASSSAGRSAAATATASEADKAWLKSQKNREACRRLRQKKQAEVADLRSQLSRLKRENAELTEKLAEADRERVERLNNEVLYLRK